MGDASAVILSGGQVTHFGMPYWAPDVVNDLSGNHTIKYLREPGVVMIARPVVELDGAGEFLSQLGFPEYLKDENPDGQAAKLSKFAGQLCYQAFGEKRTKNAEAQKYFDNVLASKHGSVIEHGNYSFLFYGVDRSFTHELVRHRAGAAFSQTSQRYVGSEALRFVERPEYQNNVELHGWFLDRCHVNAQEYENITRSLYERQVAGDPSLATDSEKKSDLRKRVQQTARSCLPNEVESPIVVTLNIRAFRHVLEMRESRHAETLMRGVFHKVFLAMKYMEPLLFNDFTENQLADGTFEVVPKWSKV